MIAAAEDVAEYGTDMMPVQYAAHVLLPSVCVNARFSRAWVQVSCPIQLHLICNVWSFILAWPSHWADKLVLIRNIPANTKPEDLRVVFVGAEDIVVAKESSATGSLSSKRHDSSAKAMG